MRPLTRELLYEAPVPEGYESARLAVFRGRILLTADGKPPVLWNPESREWEELRRDPR